MRTFYLAPEKWSSDAELTGGEAHHISDVLRLHPGDSVCLIDGKGREGNFLIRTVGRKCVSLQKISEQVHPRPSSGLTLAVAWSKEVRRSWLLEKSVEFEAEAIWFWKAERSQFDLPDKISDTWTASLIAGAKQCHNVWLPEIRLISAGVGGLIRQAESFDHRHVLVESTLPSQRFLSFEQIPATGRTICVIGPEGGFTLQEVNMLEDARFQSCSLGKRILRWETASMLALGLSWWKRQSSLNSDAE